MITTSGLIFTPGVSSSKNRSKPALAAGIGDSRLRLFSRAVDIAYQIPARLVLGDSQLNFHFLLRYETDVNGF